MADRLGHNTLDGGTQLGKRPGVDLSGVQAAHDPPRDGINERRLDARGADVDSEGQTVNV